MITMHEAETLVNSASQFSGKEKISYLESIGRYLAEDIYSDVSMPPFNKSAVDGFACRKEDLPGKLKVLEIIAAGQSPRFKISQGTCSKIMTGAEIPAGADCVVMIENTHIENDNSVLIPSSQTNGNICFLGEDVNSGDLILKNGSYIRPQELAMLASAGKTEIIVAKKVLVGLIATGSELVEPNIKPGKSSIRNSNAYQLIAQIQQAGGDARYLGIAPDDEQQLRNLISQSINDFPVTIINGGISTGDFDLVPKILKENQVEILFYKIAVQPGKPTLFGIHPNGNLIFGLPGNPVSSFIQFELRVKPYLQKCMGKLNNDNEILLPLGFEYARKKADRERWEPGILSNTGSILPLQYHGSAHLHSLTSADLIFCIPQGKMEIASGEKCRVRLFR